MSDITAVVLTTGEETTQRAIDSLNRQTLLPEAVVVIENVSPFHQALNLGASKVNTPFFIQVDVDMILDENCLADLRACMVDDVGMAVGHLRDPLVGRTVGIKMFRRKCFEQAQFEDTISPDTDFLSKIFQAGWQEVYALRFNAASSSQWHTFGEHSPDYAAPYTFRKYLLEGRRYRYRSDWGGLRSHFRKLENSSHKASLIAQVAMAHGIFLQTQEDLLKPLTRDEDFEWIQKFLASSVNHHVRKFYLSPIAIFSLKEIFHRYYKLGIELGQSNSFPTFKAYMDNLTKPYDDAAKIAKVGLCHGLFAKGFDDEVFEAEYRLLHEFLPKYKLSSVIKNKVERIARQVIDVFPGR